MGDITYSDALDAIDLTQVHAWLAQTYWSPGIPRELVERSFRRSTAVCGAFDDDRLVGVARVVSDTVRFAYLADVYVDEAKRGGGIGRGMVRFLMALPDLAIVRSWLLMTKDAHGVYESLGFGAPEHPERIMTMLRPRPW